MKMKVMALLLAMAFVLAGCGVFAQPTEPAPTEAPPVVAAHEMASLPQSLDPLAEESEELALVRSYIAGALYERTSDGSGITASMAASLPEDVTAEYAGSEIYGVPADAARGYAFRIDLNEDCCWEDGAPITADDYLRTLTLLLENEAYAPEFTAVANAEGYLKGWQKTAATVISLAEGGYANLAEAEAQGVTQFYLDAGSFWGLEQQWLKLDDTTRLLDDAMPAGLDEMYVSAAYLYRQYLAEGAAYDYMQSEFVGIGVDAPVLTLEDVGIRKTGDHQITLVFNRPTTAEALALALEDLSLLNREGLSYGPYRVVSIGAELIELEKNENFWGDTAEYPADIIRFRRAG